MRSAPEPRGSRWDSAWPGGATRARLSARTASSPTQRGALRLLQQAEGEARHHQRTADQQCPQKPRLPVALHRRGRQCGLRIDKRLSLAQRGGSRLPVLPTLRAQRVHKLRQRSLCACCCPCAARKHRIRRLALRQEHQHFRAIAKPQHGRGAGAVCRSPGRQLPVVFAVQTLQRLRRGTTAALQLEGHPRRGDDAPLGILTVARLQDPFVAAVAGQHHVGTFERKPALDFIDEGHRAILLDDTLAADFLPLPVRGGGRGELGPHAGQRQCRLVLLQRRRRGTGLHAIHFDRFSRIRARGSSGRPGSFSCTGPQASCHYARPRRDQSPCPASSLPAGPHGWRRRWVGR